MLPPGRARLATRPLRTGSFPNTKIMGMTDVACLAEGSAVIRDDDSGFQADELCGDLGGALRAAFRPPILDCDRATLAPSELTQLCRECGRPQAPVRRVRSQEADRWQPGGLLRARRERPRGRRAAEKGDELAPSHGLPSSGRGPHITTPFPDRRCCASQP